MIEELAVDARPVLEAGRAPAGRALLRWAADTGAPRLCLVAGGAGSGKSHLIAWFAAGDSGRSADRANALLLADELGPAPAVWELLRQLEYGGGSVADLLRRAGQDRRPLLIAVPGLHACGRGGSRDGTALVSEVLDPLLELPHVRVVAEVRDASAAGFAHPAHVLDLDDPELTDRDGFGAWYAALAGGDPAVPAEQVFPHPVRARLAAALPAGGVPDGDPVAAWWAGRSGPVRAALRTLAAARGPLDLDTWQRLHAALHPALPGAAEHVTEASGELAPPGGPFTLPLPRLAGLARQEARAEGDPDAEAVFDAVLGLLTTDEQGRPDWSAAPRYVLDHLLDHAPGPEFAGRLLSDPGFLVHGSSTAITAALGDRRIRVPASLRTAWYAVAPALATGPREPAARAALLHAGALGTAPRLAEALAEPAGRAVCTARWSRPRLGLPAPGGEPLQWPGGVRALAAAAPGAAPGLTLAAADPLGQLRRLDPASGACAQRVGGVPVSGARAMAALPGGGFLLLDDDGSLLVVGADGGADAGPARIAASYNAARPADGEGGGAGTVLAVGGDPAAGLLVFGDAAGAAHLHGAAGGGDEARSAVLARTPLTAVCCLAVNDGQALVAAGTAAGDVVLWASSRPPLEVPLAHREALPRSLAITVTPAGPLLAVCWSSDVVDVLTPGGDPYPVYCPHDVEAVAFTPDGLLVAGGWRGTSAWRVDARRLG